MTLNNQIKKIYNHFFSYNLEILTSYGQQQDQIINKLEFAFFHRDFILLTYQNGKTEIGKIIGGIDCSMIILKSNDKLLHLINLSDIFKIEFA